MTCSDSSPRFVYMHEKNPFVFLFTIVLLLLLRLPIEPIIPVQRRRDLENQMYAKDDHRIKQHSQRTFLLKDRATLLKKKSESELQATCPVTERCHIPSKSKRFCGRFVRPLHKHTHIVWKQYLQIGCEIYIFCHYNFLLQSTKY